MLASHHCHIEPHVTSDSIMQNFFSELPKAELHLHLEGMLAPPRVADLARKYRVQLGLEEIRRRFDSRGFAQFLELYKWATSFLREPEDYACLAEDAASGLRSVGVAYAEVTLSVGVMLLRRQDVRANFRAIRGAFTRNHAAGLGPRVQYVFDAVRQFGPSPALEVVERAAELRSEGVVAFGLGGDELSLPLADFQPVYARARKEKLRLLVHAGETGGSQQVRDAIDLLGAERVGHGIAAIRDPNLMMLLAERKIPLEICPTSNLRTKALNIQLNAADPRLEDHPLPKLYRAGVPVSLSTDDPAMFHTSLTDEYLHAHRMGLSLDELLQINRAAFEQSFLAENEREPYLAALEKYLSGQNDRP
jgi:aminodeoxyfutalosine deaminase